MANLVRNYPAFFAETYGYEVDRVEALFFFTNFVQSDSFKTMKKYSKILGFVGGILGSSSNLFFIGVMLNINGSLKPSLKLLLSLAVSDVVQCLLHIIMRYTDIDTYWDATFDFYEYSSSPGLYLVKRFLSDMYFLTDLVGHVMLVVMAADIFVAVRNPLSYRSLMSKHRSNILIVCIWIFCYLLVASSSLGIEIVIRTTRIGESYFGATGIAYFYLYCVARELNSLYFFAILCIYIAIAIQVSKHSLKSISVAKQIKMSLVLGTIVLWFMFCSCAFGTTYWSFEELPRKEAQLYHYFRGIQFVCNSFRGFINSIIYAARIPEVQGQIKSFWKKIEVTRSSTRSTVTSNRTVAKCVTNSQRTQ